MIRFVDLTPYYYADEDPSNHPVCAFLDTTTDRFVAPLGCECQIFDSDEDLDWIEGERLRDRCRSLVPDGFWRT